MEPIRSYLSELEKSQNKDRSVRILHEDLAVIDPSDHYRILAYRGKTPAKEYLTDLCGLTNRDLHFLESSLPTHRRVLIRGKHRTLLILGDLLRQTGLLIALLPHTEAESYLRALTLCGHDEVFPSPDLSLPSAADTDEDACTWVNEQFFYLDRILSAENKLGLCTRALLLANFVGCRLDQVALPVNEVPITEPDRSRLIAFLFCSLLTLRQRSGRIALDGEEETAAYRCRISLAPHAASRHKESAAFPLLSHPVFDGFCARMEGGRLTLEARLALTPALTELMQGDARGAILLSIDFFAVSFSENL